MNNEPVLDQLKCLLGVNTYGEIIPAVTSLIGDANEKKQRINDVLFRVTQYDDDRYWLDGFMRWGQVQQDIHAIIDGRELERRNE